MDRVEVTFRNMKTSEWLEQDIRERARKLEALCPEIIACRVLVGIPHKHHEQGNRFEVHIDLTVPGEEIAVSHPPLAADKDAKLAVRDAFAAAKRQVHDYSTRKRLAVKAH